MPSIPGALRGLAANTALRPSSLVSGTASIGAGRSTVAGSVDSPTYFTVRVFSYLSNASFRRFLMSPGLASLSSEPARSIVIVRYVWRFRPLETELSGEMEPDRTPAKDDGVVRVEVLLLVGTVSHESSEFVTVLVGIGVAVTSA